uniref:Histone H2A C-terminal domain-containing protein n=1 Tax=Oryzias latipes TaxID=8090 RepID=A0A3B3I889_ORYLA
MSGGTKTGGKAQAKTRSSRAGLQLSCPQTAAQRQLCGACRGPGAGLTVCNDEELNKLLGGVTIAQGGVLPTYRGCCCPKRPRMHKMGLNNPFKIASVGFIEAENT